MKDKQFLRYLGSSCNPYDIDTDKVPDNIKPFVENSTKKGECLSEALSLKRLAGKGEVYWVGKAGHAYFVEDKKNLGALAKNQADNGFEGFPEMTVAEVLKEGKSYPDIVKDLFTK